MEGKSFEEDDGDVKHLSSIKLADGNNGVLVARNSGKLELFTF